MTRALIIGACGQDGSYLTEHLTDDGYEVFGASHRPGAAAVHLDLLDAQRIVNVLYDVKPDEIYNLAAVTAPGTGWADPQPDYLIEVNAIGVLNLLRAVNAVCRRARVVHASSSAIYDPHRYGLYGASKVMAHEAVCGYRQQRGLHASNAVLYSHTSVRQSPAFLARRITLGAAAIARGLREHLELYSLDARRDWGWASDYARALAFMGHGGDGRPEDRVIRTGQLWSVREFAAIALRAAGLEGGVDRWVRTPDRGVPSAIEPTRPADGIRAIEIPDALTFEEMIIDMVKHDLAA